MTEWGPRTVLGALGPGVWGCSGFPARGALGKGWGAAAAPPAGAAAGAAARRELVAPDVALPATHVKRAAIAAASPAVGPGVCRSRG